jgi:hypothetical protein
MGKAASLANIGSIADSSLGFRNRIINGAMVIDQRNAGASVTAVDGVYTLDRWVASSSIASKYTIQQTPSATETGFATRVGAGFTNYLAATVGASASVTVGSTDYFMISQKIEGFNVADFAWGTSNAKTVTLSFWVYSSLTGTFGGALQNSAQNRSYPFSYSIASANTWTQISVTITGDTSGTWLITNGTGMFVRFGLGIGTTYSGTAGAWSGSALYAPTGAVKVIETNSATFYITGVQLEKGSTATSFDYRPYGTELQLAQRYYQFSNVDNQWVGNTTSSGAYYARTYLSTTMRTNPTVVLTNVGASGFPTTAGSAIGIQLNSFESVRTSNSSVAAGYFYNSWTASAEL